VTALTFAVKPLFRTLRRIHPSDCFTVPAAGYRHESSGDLARVGVWGAYYAAASCGAGSHGSGFFRLGTDYMGPLSVATRASALSVRCVQASATAGPDTRGR